MSVFRFFPSEWKHSCTLQGEVEIPMPSLPSISLATLKSALAPRRSMGATWLAGLELGYIHRCLKDSDTCTDDLLSFNVG
jgi:hypothetical protein